MNRIKIYFSTNYLWTPVTNTKYQAFYLYLSLLIILLTVVYRAYLMIKGKRAEVYRAFDSLWFWGGLSFGAVGLFIYFSRTQQFPIFSTRLISYLWIISIIAYGGYLIFYYRKNIPGKLTDYYSKKRKSKYLKR